MAWGDASRHDSTVIIWPRSRWPIPVFHMADLAVPLAISAFHIPDMRVPLAISAFHFSRSRRSRCPDARTRDEPLPTIDVPRSDDDSDE